MTRNTFLYNQQTFVRITNIEIIRKLFSFWFILLIFLCNNKHYYSPKGRISSEVVIDLLFIHLMTDSDWFMVNFTQLVFTYELILRQFIDFLRKALIFSTVLVVSGFLHCYTNDAAISYKS